MESYDVASSKIVGQSLMNGSNEKWFGNNKVFRCLYHFSDVFNVLNI